MSVFLADPVTIQLLFNPALPLSTYNIRCISVHQATDGEESADVKERAIRGHIIENTQNCAGAETRQKECV